MQVLIPIVLIGLLQWRGSGDCKSPLASMITQRLGCWKAFSLSTLGGTLLIFDFRW